MGFLGWHLLAYSDEKTRNGATWQVKIYEYTTDSVSSTQVKLHSDLELERGNAQRKDKQPGISPTVINFAFKDVNAASFNRMIDKSDELFRCLILKDSATYFLGFLLLITTRNNFSTSTPVLRFKAYEGFKKLKDYYDYSSFSPDYQPKTEIIRTILNTLDYDFDLRFYQNINQDPLDITDELVRIQDYLAVKPDASYYDILLMIIKQGNYEMYQYEGVWIFRQIMTFKYATAPYSLYGIKQYDIDYSTGAQTKTDVSRNAALASTDLQKDAESFRSKAYSKVQVTQPCFDPRSLPKRHNSITSISWNNMDFKLGSSSWTTSLGSPDFCDGCVKLAPGDIIYQDTDELDASTSVRISFNALCSRLILDNGDRLFEADNELVEIQFRATGGTVYYLTRDTYRWDTSSGSLTFFGLDMFGIVQGSNYLTEYTVNNLDKKIELPVPAEAGVVRILLKGGGTASGNDYPNEFVQHNFAIVELTETNDHNVIVPASYKVTAEVSGDITRVLKLDIPFADLDPYNVNLWSFDGSEYYRVYQWSDGTNDYTLAEYIARRMLAFHQDNQGVDVKLLQGVSVGYDNLIYGDLDGEGTRYYIPVYEKSKLIDDMRRFVLLEHNYASISPTVKRFYEFNTTGAGNDTGYNLPAASVSSPYNISYRGSTALALNNHYLKVVPVSFDTDFSSGVIYRIDMLDIRLIKIDVRVSNAFNAASTIVIKHNTTAIFDAARTNLQRAVGSSQEYALDLSVGDYLQAEFTLNGATAGSGYILLHLESRG